MLNNNSNNDVAFIGSLVDDDNKAAPDMPVKMAGWSIYLDYIVIQYYFGGVSIRTIKVSQIDHKN